MREIKCRGRKVETVWTKKYTDYIEQAGEFVYGSLVDLGGKDIYIVIPNEYNEDRTYDAAHKEAEYIKVYRETAGEYTGLKDKNGKEIYEGDIVTLPIGPNADLMQAIIEWEFDGWKFKWMKKRVTNIRGKTIEPVFHNIKFFEIIGNIYENGDLISVSND